MEITELFGLMNFRTSQIRYFILYFNYIFRDQKWFFARLCHMRLGVLNKVLTSLLPSCVQTSGACGFGWSQVASQSLLWWNLLLCHTAAPDRDFKFTTKSCSHLVHQIPPGVALLGHICCHTSTDLRYFSPPPHKQWLPKLGTGLRLNAVHLSKHCPSVSLQTWCLTTYSQLSWVPSRFVPFAY